MKPRYGRRRNVPRGTSESAAVAEGEEAACDRLVRGLGGEVFPFSIGARSPIPDVPDRRYRLRGVAFWAEIKRPPGLNERKDGYARKDAGDKLTQGQLDFLLAEHRCGEIVFAGDREALLRMVMARPGEWRRLGHEALAIVVARGLRTEG